jgi:serine/threonine protein kinase
LHLGRTGQNYFYAMEFVEGETLENLIKRSGRLEVERALEIATQVAAGLAAVHKQKLVHRDIKPSNIMVSLEDGGAVTAKIIDLGLAKPAPDAPAEAATHGCCWHRYLGVTVGGNSRNENLCTPGRGRRYFGGRYGSW